MTKYYYRRRNKLAFTLTELGLASLLVLIIGLVISKEASSATKNKIAVEKIQSTYNLLEDAATQWQYDNNCNGDITLCIQDARNYGTDNKVIFNGIAKYLPVVASNVDIDVNGKHITGQDVSKIDWLPEYTKTYDGNMQTNSSIGVSKYYDKNSKNLAFYKLKDGVTLLVDISDYDSNTGVGFFDINGKEGDNQIGIDVFPFSLGSDIDNKNILYDVAAKKFNPYFSSAKYESFDLCNIKVNDCSREKLATNPTVYVLKWAKLPKQMY